MFTTLLSTKLHIPPQRLNLVARPQLTQRFRLDTPVKITLVTAPAGFGKTTLLTDWIYGDLSESLSNRIAWLALDAGENIMVQFWAYVFASLQEVDPTIGKALQNSLHTATTFPPIETALTSLINELALKDQRFILVLDDFHEITNSEIHDSIVFLLDHLPANMHLCILSREDLPFPISRYRARGELNEIRAVDLRFSDDETDTFFKQLFSMYLTEKDIQTLNHRTEGWAAGLQLAALSMQSRPDKSAFIQDFAGSNRFLTDYLVDEVLSRQSEATQKFLQRTSVLERFCPEVCDELVEDTDSKSIISELENSNLFIIPLDSERKWYRYHHLFAEFLRLRLHESEPELIQELYLRAETWFTKAGFLREGLSYALHMKAYDRAVDLLITLALDVLEQDNPNLLIEWCKALPEDVLHNEPVLCAYLGAAYVFTGQIETADQWFNIAQSGSPQLPHNERGLLEGFILAHRTYILVLQGDYESGIISAEKALALLPKTDTPLRARTMCHLAGAYNYCGKLKEATKAYGKGILIAKKLDSIPLAQLSFCGLGETYREQGRLCEAMEIYQQFLAFAKEGTGMDQPPLTGNAVMEIGAIHREQYDLDNALAYVQKGIALCREWDQGVEVAIGLLELAEIHRLRGEYSEAETTLKEVRAIAEDISPWALNLVEGIAARLLLTQGKTAALARWARDAGLMKEGCELGYERFPECPALIRMHIRTGEPEKALALLDKLLERDESLGRMGRVLDLWVLKFASLDELGESIQAGQILEKAIDLANPENHLRPFVEEIDRLEAYLSEFSPSTIRDRLLNLLNGQNTPPLAIPQTQDALMEPLNEQEIRILRMMSVGQTNREIGENLFLSVNTIRWYASQIYQKMGVKNRSAAVAKGRELKIIH